MVAGSGGQGLKLAEGKWCNRRFPKQDIFLSVAHRLSCSRNSVNRRQPATELFCLQDRVECGGICEIEQDRAPDLPKVTLARRRRGNCSVSHQSRPIPIVRRSYSNAASLTLLSLLSSFVSRDCGRERVKGSSRNGTSKGAPRSEKMEREAADSTLSRVFGRSRRRSRQPKAKIFEC